MQLPTAISRSLTIIVSYFVCWQFAAVFTVATDVSAFYPAAGTLVYFIYRWGRNYLPAAVLAMLVANLPQLPFWNWSVSNYLDLLRQLAVYGGLALLARRYGWVSLPLATLNEALRLITFAAISSLFSALLALGIFWYFRPALRPFIDAIFYSFWVGDFSGILMLLGLVSVVLVVRDFVWKTDDSVTVMGRLAGLAPRLSGLVVSSLTVGGLMAILGTQGELHHYTYLILLPVIFGTVAFGLNFGISSAILANLSAVFAYMMVGADKISPLQIQLLCALVMCVGMVLGGAIADRTTATFEAQHDPMTGLLNRRAFMQQGDIMLERARRYQHSLAVIMLDLDMFKLVNDAYGHDAGDRLLCEVADQCKLITRKVDLCARMGGEEFALMIEDADAEQAVQIADRLRTMIYQLHRGTSKDPASASFGVSIFRNQGETVNALLTAADRVLYVAKETGRNRVVLDSEPASVAA